jgi:hypothetical protein
MRRRGDPISGVAVLPQSDELEALGSLRNAALGAGEVLVEGEQLAGRQPFGEAEQLSEIADRGTRLGRARRRALDLGTPVRGAHEAAGDLRQRGLPGAVRPEEPEQLARRDLEVYPAERDGGAVALLERLAAEGGGHRPQCRKLPGCH